VRNTKYNPYGSTCSSTGSKDNARKYTGQVLDDQTNLYYYNARYYDPVLCQFITPDTRVSNPFNPQNLNRYTYCLNNPIKYIDPSGHDADVYLSISKPATPESERRYREGKNKWENDREDRRLARQQGREQRQQERLQRKEQHDAEKALGAADKYGHVPVSGEFGAYGEIVSNVGGDLSNWALGSYASTPLTGPFGWAVGTGVSALATGANVLAVGLYIMDFEVTGSNESLTNAGFAGGGVVLGWVGGKVLGGASYSYKAEKFYQDGRRGALKNSIAFTRSFENSVVGTLYGEVKKKK